MTLQDVGAPLGRLTDCLLLASIAWLQRTHAATATCETRPWVVVHRFSRRPDAIAVASAHQRRDPHGKSRSLSSFHDVGRGKICRRSSDNVPFPLCPPTEFWNFFFMFFGWIQVQHQIGSQETFWTLSVDTSDKSVTAIPNESAPSTWLRQVIHVQPNWNAFGSRIADEAVV